MNGKCTYNTFLSSLFYNHASHFSNTSSTLYFSCTQRNAYHLVFPDDASTEDKLTLIGSSILVDVIFNEQNGGGGEN